MQKVVVASKNPVKVAAVRLALERTWPEKEFHVEGIAAASGVSDQPKGDEETLLGARNRTRNAQDAAPDADLWVGLEGGIVALDDTYMTKAWMVVWNGTREGVSQSACFQLPPAVCRLLDEGLELGDADDQVFGSQNSKQSGGALGLLTGNKLNRTELYVPAVMMALIPFAQSDLYVD